MKKSATVFIILFSISTTVMALGEIRSQNAKANAEIFPLGTNLFLVAEKPAEQIRSIELMPNQQLSIDSQLNEHKIRDDRPIQYSILKDFNQKQQLSTIPAGTKVSSKAHAYGFNDHTVILIEWYDAQYQRLGWHISAYNDHGDLVNPPIEVELPRGSINYNLLRLGNFDQHGFTNIQSYEKRSDPEFRDLLTISQAYPQDRFTGDTYTFDYRKGVLQRVNLDPEQIQLKQARRTSYCTEMFSQFKAFADHNVLTNAQISPLDKSNPDTLYFFDHLHYHNLTTSYEQDLIAYHQYRNLRYAEFDQKYCHITALRNSLEKVTQPDGSIKTQIVLREGIGSNIAIKANQVVQNSQTTMSNSQPASRNNSSVNEVENNLRELKNSVNELKNIFKW